MGSADSIRRALAGLAFFFGLGLVLSAVIIGAAQIQTPANRDLVLGLILGTSMVLGAAVILNPPNQERQPSEAVDGQSTS
jgi:hypothetical protein